MGSSEVVPRISELEQLLGDDKEAFLLMLEGAFVGWQGTYDVLMPDTASYLLGTRRSCKSNPLCGSIRRTVEGESLCLESELEAAGRAGDLRQCLMYSCRAGLRDVAVPIIVNDRLIATIFCGQVRPQAAEWDELGLEQTKQLEQRLGFPPGELEQLWHKVPCMSDDELEKTARRIFTMARFVSRMLERNAQLARTNEALEHLQAAQARAADRLGRIDKAVSALLPLTNSWDDLWRAVGAALRAVTEVYCADQALFLMTAPDGIGSQSTVTCVAVNQSDPMRLTFFPGGEGPPSDLSDRDDVRIVRIQDLPPANKALAMGTGRSAREELSGDAIEARVRLSPEVDGRILLIFGSRNPPGLEHEADKVALTVVSGRIAQAYGNTKSHLSQMLEEKERRFWVQRISHQIIAPLNGVIGHAEVMLGLIQKWRKYSPERFAEWPEEDLIRLINRLDAVLWTADWSARLIRNLAWMAGRTRVRETLNESDLEPIADVCGYLVDCARFVQGVARERHVSVHVDEDSASLLNGRLRVYSDYFRQAVLNLLDNAVKYSDEGSEIAVSCLPTNGHCRIRITNYGLPLHKEDCERIFEYEYRTAQARSGYPTGTGIGLSIARELITLHGGRLDVSPSEKTPIGWRTTFDILLPLGKNRQVLR